jgi:hypothetical protein
MFTSLPRLLLIGKSGAKALRSSLLQKYELWLGRLITNRQGP